MTNEQANLVVEAAEYAVNTYLTEIKTPVSYNPKVSHAMAMLSIAIKQYRNPIFKDGHGNKFELKENGIERLEEV